jgi:hypothetical protein
MHAISSAGSKRSRISAPAAASEAGRRSSARTYLDGRTGPVSFTILQPCCAASSQGKSFETLSEDDSVEDDSVLTGPHVRV